MSLRARNTAPTLLGATKGDFDVFFGDIETRILKGRDIYRIARRVSPVYMMEIKYEKAEVRENVVRSENKMENMQRAEIKLKLQQ